MFSGLGPQFWFDFNFIGGWEPVGGHARWLNVKANVINAVAGRVELSGPDVAPTNNQAIVAGPPTNIMVVARTGFPAPGTSGNFVSFDINSRHLALTPAGNVAFIAVAEGTSGFPGVWFGRAGTVESILVQGGPAPASLLGPGYSYAFLGSANVEVKAKGELAFSASLTGPGLTSTNSDLVIAGLPGALRVIAQSGQPAPGIPGAFFSRYFGGSSSFNHVLLGADGTVAFVASYSTNSYDFGLWLAPTNGTTPILLMRTGQQAPGTPAGVAFMNSFQALGGADQAGVRSGPALLSQVRRGDEDHPLH